MDLKNKIFTGHALEILKEIPDCSVNMCITSPPYWCLRDYNTNPAKWNDGWEGELGAEPNFEQYINHLCDIFDEVKRVLKDDGSCWVNIGDTYGGSCLGITSGGKVKGKTSFLPDNLDYLPRVAHARGKHSKSLLLIPFRFAVEMMQDLPILAATKLKPINFYFFPKMLGEDNGAADCKRCLDQAVKYGVPRVMVVPSHFTKGGDEEAEFAKDLSSMKMFVAEAKKRGITITVEDFGGPQNPGSHMKYLKRFLDEIPELKFALDSGNLYYAGRGEDILEMMAYAKDRIAHVHLKDQTPENNRKYATLGLGAVPNEKIVKTMAASGYKGWYTLENTVGDAYTDSIRQVAVLKHWLKTATK